MNHTLYSSEQPKFTIKQLAESLHPGWDFKKDWLCWPPDTFALISVIMERTGCYRLCLIDPTWWRKPSYSSTVDSAAKHWLLKTTNLLMAKNNQTLTDDYFITSHKKSIQEQFDISPSALEKFKESVTTICNLWDVIDLEKLRTLNYNTEKDNPYRKITEALIHLLAMADVACAGMGLLEKSTDSPTDTTQLSHCLANLLLTATGSLSSLPKFHGAVLPKMRTPQGGITTRSLSHHLTFHTSEVEVMWRTIPWSNHHQKTLNIIVVPFPFDISEDNFEPRSERFHSVQYFSYSSTLEGDKVKANFYLDKVVDLVWQENQKLGHVHILIFPESALSSEQYTYIKERFYDKLISIQPELDINKQNSDTIHYLPLIVSGIHNGASKPYSGEEDYPGHNEMRMATFFAGKWYDVAQRKHHRWHLNSNQLKQYWLAGKLPSERRWFEHISVAQRRLTILAPTGWLALTSLICEDLAQLEPVSSIIRGIGPTFLMALLSDGPQLTNRWSARYANVMADDPGTAVLSLTSLGMVKRSHKLTNELYIDDNTPNQPTHHTIALWKDMLRGQQEVNLTDNKYKAVRLTISAKYEEEHTLDGRSDGEMASVFQLEGFQQLEIGDFKVIDKNDALVANIPITDLKPALGNWTDIRELTALQYTLDSLIELRGQYCQEICDWFRAEPKLTNEYPTAIQIILRQMAGALKDPGEYGIDAEKSGWIRNDKLTDVEIVADALQVLFNKTELQAFISDENSPVEYYEYIFKAAENQFELAKNDLNKQDRIHYLVPIATVYLIHAKISGWELSSMDVPNKNDIASIVNLRKGLRNFIIKHQYGSYKENKK